MSISKWCGGGRMVKFLRCMSFYRILSSNKQKKEEEEKRRVTSEFRNEKSFIT